VSNEEGPKIEAGRNLDLASQYAIRITRDICYVYYNVVGLVMQGPADTVNKAQGLNYQVEIH
jgi:hypothetical protein